MKEGVVLEIYSSYVGVMTPGGEFLKVRKDCSLCEIGEEIWFNEAAIIYPGVKNFFKNYSFPKLALRSVTATAIMAIFFSATIINYNRDSALGELVSFFDGRSDWDNVRLANRDTSSPGEKTVAISEPKMKDPNDFFDKESNRDNQPNESEDSEVITVDSEFKKPRTLKRRDDVEETAHNNVVAFNPVDNGNKIDNISSDKDNFQTGEEPGGNVNIPPITEPNSEEENGSDSSVGTSPSPSGGIKDEYVGSDTWGEDEENNSDSETPAEDNNSSPDEDGNEEIVPEEPSDNENENPSNGSSEENEEDPISSCEKDKECSCSKNGYYIEYETILTFEENEQGEVVEVYKEMPIKKYCENQQPEEPQSPEGTNETEPEVPVDNENTNSNTDETLLPSEPSYEYDGSNSSLNQI